MNGDKVMAEKIQTARMKLLTVWDSAYVAQYEHYIVSNSCLFCIGGPGSCAVSPEKHKERGYRKGANKPTVKP